MSKRFLSPLAMACYNCRLMLVIYYYKESMYQGYHIFVLSMIRILLNTAIFEGAQELEDFS